MRRRRRHGDPGTEQIEHRVLPHIIRPNKNMRYKTCSINMSGRTWNRAISACNDAQTFFNSASSCSCWLRFPTKTNKHARTHAHTHKREREIGAYQFQGTVSVRIQQTKHPQTLCHAKSMREAIHMRGSTVDRELKGHVYEYCQPSRKVMIHRRTSLRGNSRGCKRCVLLSRGRQAASGG